MPPRNFDNNYPLVSVLMTAYNREQFIREAIESVLDSTYPNFELIVVDDSSIDNTFTIAKEIAIKDDRVKVYRNDDNLGDYPNRNKAASYAKGKYIKYVDSDDRIYADSLMYMVEVMEQFENAAFGFCDTKNHEIGLLPKFYNGREALRTHFLNGGLLQAGPSTTIIRRDAFEMMGGFSGKRYVSDYEAWLNLCLEYGLVVFEKDLVWLRAHSQQENEVGKIAYYSLNYNLHKTFLNNPANPFTKDEKTRLLYNYRILLGRRIYQRVIRWFGIKKTLSVIHDTGESYLIFLWAFMPMKKVRNIGNE
jgi:glycosyltransferase involved in cell wall biosynthesis